MNPSMKITQIAPGILRLRVSVHHAQTLAERYQLITLPERREESGIQCASDILALPNGRRLRFSLLSEAEYQTLHDSLAAEFAAHFTDYQAIIGAPKAEPTAAEDAPPEQPAPQIGTVPAESVPAGAHFAVRFSIGERDSFYGLGEASCDRVELRGRAYQNWVRYQYNEISVPLLLSSGGYGFLLNASGRSFVDIDHRAPGELLLLGESDELDLFILAADDLRGLLNRAAQLTGMPMLLPKWAYGLTYIAPVFATQEDVLRHAERFRQEGIPCDAFSLEPGWMEKFYDYSTSKTWETRRFHVTDYMVGDRKEITFIAALKRYGFHLALWLCIRHDLTGQAERELAFPNAPETDHATDGFGEAWYDHLKKFTELGVDGYKLDPADMVCCFDRMNRPKCRNGLTPMQMHNTNQTLLARQMYEGYTRQTGRRPLLHYCGGYTGTQKWCAATTGDNGGELGAMIWLETLAMTGFMNTTIDMNIHHPESIHFGMLVPWAHLNAWHGAEQPWWAGEELHRMFTEYARMRYRILPYIYSAAIEGHETACPMVRPMALEYPNDSACAAPAKQYLLGPSLLVTAYADQVYLPAGRWTDAFTGDEYVGPCTIEDFRPSAGRGGGLFIRGGAVIPNWSDRRFITEKDERTIALDIWPDGNSDYVFREDDGVSLDCNVRFACRTKIEVHSNADAIRVHIGAREGEYNGKPDVREWVVRAHLLPGDERPVCVDCAPGDTVRSENALGETIFAFK